MAAASASVLPVWRPECILPVPMHPKKRAERGFDQSLLLASALGSLTGIRVEERALVRTRYTKASKKLGRESRKKNMRGVFALDPAVRLPARVLLLEAKRRFLIQLNYMHPVEKARISAAFREVTSSWIA